VEASAPARVSRRFPWYQRLVRPVLFRLPPERAQRLAERTLACAPLWRAYGATLRVDDATLPRSVAGINLRNPIGLAAGLDKQCAYLAALGHLGFGYVIGGTVTYHPRPGNARPRLLRLPERESLLNSMGFPSEGLQAAVTRLRNLGDRPAKVFVSIAALEEDEAVACLRALEPLVEATEVNISSPNTAGVRRFQEPAALGGLLDRLNAARAKPLFVKLPPYDDDRGRDAVLGLLRVCLRAGVAGVTAINTVPRESPSLAVERGGLSGRAILPDMLRIVPELRREAGPGFVINASGGIATGDDAFRALQAGADTVQLYTAFVYRGPDVVNQICRELAVRLRQQVGR